jgi:pimeloyl-ACP methyl ester carboxylesterase
MQGQTRAFSKALEPATVTAWLLLVLLARNSIHCCCAQVQRDTLPVPELPPGFCDDYATDTDISFIGPQLSIAAGSLPAISYHRFGPLAKTNAQSNTSPFTMQPRPPLLLITGFGVTMYDWGVKPLRALAQNREVIIFNNPGIGNSSFPTDIGTEKNLTYADLANHTVNLIQALQLPLLPDVAGIAQGGTIAMYIVTHQPSVINNLIVVASTTQGPQAPQSETLLDMSSDEADVLTTNETAMLERLQFPSGLPGHAGLCGAVTTMQAFAPMGSLIMAPIEVLEQYAWIQSNKCSTEISDALLEVRNRVMFVHGQQDVVVPVAAAQAAAAQVPRAWLVVFADAGHGLPQSYPDRFAAVVDVFLDTVDPMSAAAAEIGRRGRLPECP